MKAPHRSTDPPVRDQVRPASLRVGVLGPLSDLVVGLAATGPAYSLTATLVLLVTAVGVQAPAALLLAFVPSVLIALACRELNRAHPDCGTTFIWSAKAFGAHVGLLAAWTLLVTDLVVMASMAHIAGKYTFLLFGNPVLAENEPAVAAVGTLFILAMTGLCVLGIELSVRAQLALLCAEVGALAAFAVFAVTARCVAPDAGCALLPQAAWFDPRIATGPDLARGVLLATFLYWGWDTALVVNEETVDSRCTPGRAVLLAMALLLAIYLLVTVAALSYAGTGAQGMGLTNPENKDDALLAIGTSVFRDGPGDSLLVLAVLTSALAGIQTTALAASRLCLSLARMRALPAWCARIDRRWQTPALVTVAIGVLCAIFFVVVGVFGGDLLDDSITSLGLLIAFYYALTAFACVRSVGLQARTAREFIKGFALPLAGGLMLTAALLATAVDLAAVKAGKPSVAGYGRALVFGVGSLALGLLVATVGRWLAAGYFSSLMFRQAQGDDAAVDENAADR